MKKRLFAYFMMFAVLWNVHMSSYAQAQFVAKPFTGLINDAIAGTIVKYAIRRGFAANDPRIALTMQAVGKVVDVSVNSGAAIDTALLVAGAPVWATAALALATAGVIGFGAYQIYKAMAKDPNTGQMVQTVKVVDTTKSTDSQNADPVVLTKADLLNSTSVSNVNKTVSAGKVTLVKYMDPSCNVATDPPCANNPVSPPSRYFYRVDAHYYGYPFNTASELLYIIFAIQSGDVNTTYSWLVPPTLDSNGNLTSATGTYKLVYPQKDQNGNYTGTYGTTTGPANFSVRTDARSVGVYYGVSLGDALDQLPAAAQSAVMTTDAMADIVSQAMIKAAADPAYQGLPYSVTAPVTGADVAAWQADASSGRTLPMTTFEAAVEPAGATSVTIAPTVTAANPYAVDTSVLAAPSNVNVINVPNVNVINKVSVDLGADPGITSLNLESTPTATTIFKPVMDSVKSLAVYTVPSHPSECPKPTFQIFDKSILMDGHCNLLDSIKPTLFSVMAAVWIVVGIIIILGA